jgi:hypothetical protein
MLNGCSSGEIGRKPHMLNCLLRVVCSRLLGGVGVGSAPESHESGAGHDRPVEVVVQFG